MLASMLAVGGFIWLIVASFPYEQAGRKSTMTSKVLPDGQIEYTYLVQDYYGIPISSEIYTGNIDKQGKWHGNLEQKVYDKLGRPTAVLTGPYVDGKEHGTFTITNDPFDRVEYIEYEMGRSLGKKSAAINNSTTTAFDIIRETDIIYLEQLKLFSMTDSMLREYTDSLEVILNRQEFARDSFSIFYDDALDELGQSPKMDSITDVVNLLIAPKEFYIMKSNEFRLAVLDRCYLTEPVPSFSIISNGYPGYLRLINPFEISNEDFEAYCQDHDSVMDSYPPLDREDPFFTDSVDARLYRAMGDIIDSTDAFNMIQEVKELFKNGQTSEARYEAGKTYIGLRLKSSSYSPSMIMYVIIYLTYQQGLEADFIRNAVKEAFFLNHNWAQLPVVTTVYSSTTSATSVIIRGNVMESSGADVTDRGITWAESYNPSENDHVIPAGNGTGIFFVSIDGLDPGKTYNVRSYATNSAGTVYGNNIGFTTSRASSVELPQLPAEGVNLFPNPVSQIAMLSYSVTLPGIYQVSILDINGREVYFIETRHQATGSYIRRLDLTAVQSGIYFCRISNGRSVTAIKLLVAK